jgi:hypothetical protein
VQPQGKETLVQAVERFARESMLRFIESRPLKFHHITKVAMAPSKPVTVTEAEFIQSVMSAVERHYVPKA